MRKKIAAIRTEIALHHAAIVALENELVVELAKDREQALSPAALFDDRTRRLTNVLYGLAPGLFVSRSGLLKVIFKGDEKMLDRSVERVRRDLAPVEMGVEYVENRGYRILWN